MRTLVVLALCVACTGTTASAPPPAVGAGSQPVRSSQPAPDKELRTDVKKPGNLPVRTRAELNAEADVRKACMDACTKGDDDCVRACDRAHPMMQVEVIDIPPDLPPPE